MEANATVPDAVRLPIAQLRLDPDNPRLPEGTPVEDERAIERFIASRYNVIELGRSMASHGYFSSEPVIAVHNGATDTYIVVEGNRRLVSARLLRDPERADGLDEAAEWRELSEQAGALDDRVPVVIAPTRDLVAPIIGYRHISGIEPWDPYQKARFISRLVRAGKSFDEVGVIVGERGTDVAAAYRNHAIVEQARQDEVDATRVVRRFGVFTRALNSQNVRAHIGAPTPADVTADGRPYDPARQDRLRELFSWLFGDDAHDAVIGESRGITDLGTVLGSEDGVRVLRETRDMEAAFAAAGGLRARLVTRLERAALNLEQASDDFAAYGHEEEIQSLLNDCRQRISALDELVAADRR